MIHKQSTWEIRGLGDSEAVVSWTDIWQHRTVLQTASCVMGVDKGAGCTRDEMEPQVPGSEDASAHEAQLEGAC